MLETVNGIVKARPGAASRSTERDAAAPPSVAVAVVVANVTLTALPARYSATVSLVMLATRTAFEGPSTSIEFRFADVSSTPIGSPFASGQVTVGSENLLFW